MKIIEKIEIKNFRSFLGTTKDDKAEIEEITDLNIFSGANDSGKSNILRALNLFFNDEISIDDEFVFERDFPKQKKDDYQRVIEIKIHFNLLDDNNRDSFLPEKFSISKFYAQDNDNKYRDYLLMGINKQGEEIKIFTNPDKNKNKKSEKTKSEKQYRQHLWGFLNKFSFEYVPAIRDKYFFKRLFGRAISGIKKQEDQKIKKLENEQKNIKNHRDTIRKKENLIKAREKKIKEAKNKKKNKIWSNEIAIFKKDILNLRDEKWRISESKKIEDELEKTSVIKQSLDSLKTGINSFSDRLFENVKEFLPSEFQIGEDLSSFFEEFDIGTGDNKSISLRLRGDGMQAKFIPEVLDFINSNQKDKKYFIWGFEEPENSSEYKNQQELAQKLKKDFIKNKQIFLTTHSEEFLSLYDSAEIKKEERKSNLYHVKKTDNNLYKDFSIIKLFDVEKQIFDFLTVKSDLENDLGTSLIRAKYSKELIEKDKIFLEEKDKIEEENKKLQEIIYQDKKPIIFVEDKYYQIYKIAWLKLFKEKCDKENFEKIFNNKCPFSFYTLEGASNLSGFLRMQSVDYWKNKKIIGIFDFDEEGVKQFKCLKNKTCWKNSISGDKSSGIFKKRSDHDCFYSLLIPIPERLDHLASLDFPSVVEIENLLSDKFLLENSFASEKITTGNTKYLQIKEDKKSEIWKKLFDLDQKDFENFKSLFDKIEELLK